MTSTRVKDTLTVDDELKVLIVDDDPTVLNIHAALIRRLGAVATKARNGEEAVNLHRDGTSFNLVLMDKEMPVMDGLLATKQLRAMGVKSMIVGVTSLANEEDQKKAFMEAGLNHCLGKPLTIDMISTVLNQLKNNI